MIDQTIKKSIDQTIEQLNNWTNDDGVGNKNGGSYDYGGGNNGGSDGNGGGANDFFGAIIKWYQISWER